jgi:hypothetical protein
MFKSLEDQVISVDLISELMNQLDVFGLVFVYFKYTCIYNKYIFTVIKELVLNAKTNINFPIYIYELFMYFKRNSKNQIR